MTLPFTHDQFLDVLGAYNAVLWPFVAALWLVTVVVTIQWFRGRAGSSTISVLLAVHWVWSGIAYHALFFTRINPAAWLFAVLFVGGGAAFVWFGVVRRRLAFDFGSARWHMLAASFVVYSLAYPGLCLLIGLEWPRMPVFGVPCPTVLFTAGMLLSATPPIPAWVVVAPTAWALIGGTAALGLGITPDLALFVAAIAMASYAVSSGRWFVARARGP